MKFYPSSTLNTISAGQGSGTGAGGAAGDAAPALPGAAPVIAIRVADLVSPAGRALAGGDRTALVVAGTPRIRAGDQLLFVKVVAVAAAVIRRDGRIQAAGHPACHARLGALEQQLDELAGPGVIDEIAARATLTGKVKGEARRAMTAAFAIRATTSTCNWPSLARSPSTRSAQICAPVSVEISCALIVIASPTRRMRRSWPWPW